MLLPTKQSLNSLGPTGRSNPVQPGKRRALPSFCLLEALGREVERGRGGEGGLSKSALCHQALDTQSVLSR